ncbi:hypothetical protein [Paraburkholderia sp. BR10954]|uniref:hypothetical protein n=1 Tax=Paraburkholderia sp. BR10954 TaxID=3236995 RepID=UPI0034D2F202
MQKARSPDVHGKPCGFALVGFFSGVPIIQHLDTPGCRSVTNAAESVVAAALAVMDGPAPEVIVYRDSMGSSTGCSSARKTASPDIVGWRTFA